MNRTARYVVRMLPLTLAAAIAMTPFAWLVCATFKRADDLFVYPLLPWHDLSRLTFANYLSLFTNQPFLRWLTNSAFLASTQTVIVVTLSSIGGFALAKYRFRGRAIFMGAMFATMLLPAQVLIPSTYELIWKLGWVDSYAAVLVPGAVSVFGMFLFSQSMKVVPDELLHAGRIDGCSELRLWWEIALPIVRPMTGAFTLLTFIGSWNSFLWPQIVLQSESKYTLPIGMANLVSEAGFTTNYSVLMCGTLLSVVPVIVLFIALQKDFIAGLSSGAVK